MIPCFIGWYLQNQARFPSEPIAQADAMYNSMYELMIKDKKGTQLRTDGLWTATDYTEDIEEWVTRYKARPRGNAAAEKFLVQEIFCKTLANTVGNSWWYFSLCDYFVGVREHMSFWHCTECKECQHWKEWHCETCKKFRHGVTVPCKRCGGVTETYMDMKKRGELRPTPKPLVDEPDDEELSKMSLMEDIQLRARQDRAAMDEYQKRHDEAGTTSGAQGGGAASSGGNRTRDRRGNTSTVDNDGDVDMDGMESLLAAISSHRRGRNPFA